MPLRQILDIRKKVFGEVKVNASSLAYILASDILHQTFSILGSQMGDERPVSMVRFSPNNSMLATGSWSGSVKLWNIPACSPIRTLRGNLSYQYCITNVQACANFLSGHGDRVGGLAWHPKATISQSEDAVNLVSGAGDFQVNLWSLNR